MDHKKKVVIIGGGNGSAISIQAVKSYLDHYSISAVVGMSDSGRSSGKFRKEFGVLPPADILRAILAMSPHDYDFLKRMFYDVRVEDVGKLHGLAVGHLFFGLTAHYSGNILDPIELLERAVDSTGHVFPATLSLSDLCVELSNGVIVRGEGAIDRPIWDRSITITRAWLEPAPQIYPEATRVIEEADILIIGPGSCYTSIVATLLTQGMKEAIERSRAKLVFIAGNTVESNGETGPRSTSELVSIVQFYLPRQIDMVFSNTVELTSEQKAFYEKKYWERLIVDTENVSVPVITESFERDMGSIDPQKLGDLIHKYILTLE